MSTNSETQKTPVENFIDNKRESWGMYALSLLKIPFQEVFRKRSRPIK